MTCHIPEFHALQHFCNYRILYFLYDHGQTFVLDFGLMIHILLWSLLFIITNMKDAKMFNSIDLGSFQKYKRFIKIHVNASVLFYNSSYEVLVTSV